MNDEASLGSLADRCPPRMMQEGESSKAYAAFQAYVDLGDARTLPDLVKKWDGSKNSLYSWANKYRWHERIDAATAEVAAIYRRETEKKAEMSPPESPGIGLKSRIRSSRSSCLPTPKPRRS